MDKYIGKKLEGRYEITELIGVGGMADVYKATDIIDNKEVAVKILKKEFAENEEFLRRFRNESKAIALLSHPNIVKVYDVGFSDKLQFIVMEYIDGITLKEYMENEGALTWKDSVHFIVQILRALQHAHDRGIVHRDIKPQNIMLFTDGTIKVMDFGIAKFAREDGVTATDKAIGTVHYISPEQARGGDTDEKSDIYSVGVMMYEMLTGQKPFDTDNPISVAVMQMQDIPERPRSINPDIPAGLEEIILHAMEKSPDDRYQTASDMIRDIEAFKADTSKTFGYISNASERTQDAPQNDPPTQYFNTPEQSEEDEEEDYDEYDEEYDEYSEGDDEEEYDEEEEEEEENDEEGDDDDDEEEPERHSLFVPVMTAVTIAFIVVAVFFVLWLIKGVLSGESGFSKTKYAMPDLVGMDYYEAKDTYTYLDIQINDTEYSNYEKDIIFSQDVAVDEAVTNGQTIYVNVSLGVSMTKVPDVKGYHNEYAKKILQQDGFIVEEKYEMSSDGTEASDVIRTEPAAGEEAESGSTIILYVSKGQNSDSIEITNMVGMTIDQAKTLCEYYGLVVDARDEPSLEDENIVIAQSLEPGEFAQAGDTVVLTYSNGEDPSGTVTYKLQIPAEVTTGRFVFDFIDASGVTKISSPIINAGYSNNVEVEVSGTGTEQIAVVLLNSITGQQCEVGVYNFDFANLNYEAVREDVHGAFDSVGAIPTEPPTEAPTQAPVVQPEPVPAETNAPTVVEINPNPNDDVPAPDDGQEMTNPPAPDVN
ncbi:MAG TPA: Stk1 family PASTA domain-containing Ser/Thr kinase [Ruminococcus sp.]|nr:Stk1 family PASTA domain-containing Ser/Thr kinase [Ruminococcus sp.]